MKMLVNFVQNALERQIDDKAREATRQIEAKAEDVIRQFEERADQAVARRIDSRRSDPAADR